MDYEFYYVFPDETEEEVLDYLRRERDEDDDCTNERGKYAPTFEELYERMSDMLTYTDEARYRRRIQRYLYIHNRYNKPLSNCQREIFTV